MVLIIGDGKSDRFARLAESFLEETAVEAARQGIVAADQGDAVKQIALAAFCHTVGPGNYAGVLLAKQVALFLEVQDDANAALDVFVKTAWAYHLQLKGDGRG